MHILSMLPSLRSYTMVCALMLVLQGTAQTLIADMLFSPNDMGHGHADGAQSFIYDHASDADGRIYVVGNFFQYSGTQRTFIARLHPDGSLDHGFDVGSGPNSTCFSVVVQHDGKPIIAGSFHLFNGQPHVGVVRLNTDGSVDAGFQTGSGAFGASRVALAPDGKILVGGSFNNFNGVSRRSIVRLHADGSIDPTFNTPAGFNSSESELPIVSVMEVRPGGRIMIGGVFNTYAGASRKNIARLNDDGSLDTGFDPGTGFSPIMGSSSVYCLVFQPDGRMVVGGSFGGYNGVNRNCIARLFPDGTLDTSFNPGSGMANAEFDSPTVLGLSLGSDGKVIAGGDFGSFNGVPVKNLVRLHPVGAMDASFSSGSGTDQPVFGIRQGPGDQVILHGFFTRYNEIGRTRIARIGPHGDLDHSFHAFGGGFNQLATNQIPVQALLQRSDGRLLAGGYFTSAAGHSRNNLACLLPDGTLDLAHEVGTGTDRTVTTLAEAPDGRMLLAGHFTSYNGHARNRLVRVHSDGSIDPTFDPGIGPGHWVNSVAVQQDGRILAGGNFNSFNDMTYRYIVRLEANGSVDPSWNPGMAGSWSHGFNGEVHVIMIQPDGRALVGGNFSTYNMQPAVRLVRLMEDGTLDATFQTGTGFSHAVRSLAIDAGGRILVGGNFTNFDGSPQLYLCRLNADGSRDQDFVSPTVDGAVHSIACMPDGRIVIGGAFNNIDWTPRSRLAVLQPHGPLDATISTGSGFNGTVTTLVLQDDSLIIAAGAFTAYDGVGRNRICRLRHQIIVGQEEIVQERTVLYPNPATDMVMIPVQCTRVTEIKVFDMNGRVIRTGTRPPGDRVQVDLAGLPAGVYHITWQNDKGCGTGRVVKE
jgi:uncharacterized delta-60 repeat protein